MNDKQLTSEDRYTISSLRKQGLTATAIAEELVRDRNKIYREVKEIRATMIVTDLCRQRHEPEAEDRVP